MLYPNSDKKDLKIAKLYPTAVIYPDKNDYSYLRFVREPLELETDLCNCTYKYDKSRPESYTCADYIEGSDLEIVSPVMTVTGGYKFLQTFIGLLGRLITVKENTGIHINLGSRRGLKNFNLIKFVILLQYDEIVKHKFRDYNGQYFKVDILEFVEKNFLGFTDLLKPSDRIQSLFLDKLIQDGKFSSVNVQNYRKGYIEYRHLGGKNYTENTSLLLKTYLHILKCFEDSNTTKSDSELKYKKALKSLFKQISKFRNL
ncbi:hypothetical protein ThvES_00013340 [Thiovulum sp. ES]|nr:hypothetical protein ThvES_00013340 [Thiovulum sp. ES]